jgi:tRNA pseudouridine55 synthase
VSAYDGFFVVDKPSGVTSFSIVSLIRRLTGVRRVGHAGTLDPLASGVLPVAVGQATRLIEYMDDESKVYLAELQFGISTDSYDGDGAVTATRDASSLRRDDLEPALRRFVGDIQQTPPIYSALKVGGRPLYQYARQGEYIALKPRTVHIESIDLRDLRGDVAEIEVRCGKGTYIRSLAHDVGERLGFGAHLRALRRMQSGGFSIEDANEPLQLEHWTNEGRLAELLLSPDRPVERRPAAILDAAHIRELAEGRNVTLAAADQHRLCRAYTLDGTFFAMLVRQGDAVWHPQKVFARNVPAT